MSTKLKICDPHFHVWNPKSHSWLNNKEGLKNHPVGDMRELGRDYNINEYLSESKKYILDKSVHIQCFDDNPLQETSSLQKLYSKYKHPSGIIAYAQLQSQNIETIIKSHLKYPCFRGIRQCLDYHPIHENRRLAPSPNLMLDPSFHNGLKVLAKYNLLFDLQLYPSQMKLACVMISSHSNLTFIINHCGFPLPNEFSVWKEGILLLSKCKNAYIKLSGWGIFDNNFSKNNYMEIIIKYILNTFGINRCMFASDFPVDKIHNKFDYYWDNYIKILKNNNYNITQINKLIYFNAVKIYKLKSMDSNDSISKL